MESALYFPHLWVMWVGGMIVWAGFVSQGLEDHPKETGLSPRSRDVCLSSRRD